jgi:hypothetical protein
MRPFLVSLATLLIVGLASSAHAERRMFIIANDISYGVDNCLASGERCGAAAANAYCRGHQFAVASSYREVNSDDITGAIPAGGSCSGDKCDDLVAIVCTR